MTVDEVVERAVECCQLDVMYSLGAGAPWTSPTPGDEQHCCDCSGFVAWVFGYSRYQPGFAWLRALNGGWMNTDGIYEDTKQPTGLWSFASEALLGGVLVYPSKGYARKNRLEGTGPGIGHVGVIVSPDGLRVVHCSAGNQRKFNRAIAETDASVFLRTPYTIAARNAGVDQ